MIIRKTTNGTYHLIDLRRAVFALDGVTVYRCGGRWIVSRWFDSIGWVQSTPYRSEREALARALGLSVWGAQYETDNCAGIVDRFDSR